MVHSLNNGKSSLDRLSRDLKSWIDENIDGLIFRPDVDVDANNIPWGPRDRKPIYNYRLQILPETRTIPIHSIRLNFFFGINRTFGNDSQSQYETLMMYRDQIHKLMMDKKTSDRLQARELRIINSSVNSRTKTDTLILLTQFEFKAFRRQGEI